MSCISVCQPREYCIGYDVWMQCPPKFGSPPKFLPKITVPGSFGGLIYEMRKVVPTPPILCSPPPYYPIMIQYPNNICSR